MAKRYRSHAALLEGVGVGRKDIAALQKVGWTRDTFTNFLTKTGIGTQNLSSGNTYGFNPISRNRTLIEWMYRGSWICGVAVDCVADDMTREGVILTSSMPVEDQERLNNAMRRFQIWPTLNLVGKWARLYGGSLGYIVIDGQDPSTPLKVDTIKKGQFKGVIPLDEWMVTPDLTHSVLEPGPEYGNPAFYNITATSPQFPFPRTRVHYSRCVRMLGIELPYWQRTMENMWGISILERIYDRLTAFDSTTQGAAQLVYKAYLRTYKVKGLRQIIAAGGDAMTALSQQIEMTRLYQSNEGLTLMDMDDEFEAHQYTFSGLSDVLASMAEQISGATQIPLARLFGQSPSGLNATGDHDLRTYYDNIKRLQERWFRRPLDVILRVMAASEGIEVDDQFEYDFASLWQMTDDEKSTVDAANTQSVMEVAASGMISPAMALKELRARGRQTGTWTSITDEDIEAAEKGDMVPSPKGLISETEAQEEQERQAALIAPANENEGEEEGEKKPPPKSAKKTAKAKAKDSARIFDWNDLPLHIETAAGEYREGRGWRTLMLNDYGFIAGIPSAEGGQEELDCYLGPDRDSKDVFVINQCNPETHAFDEHKCMLGFRDAPLAIAAYNQAFSDGRGMARLMSMVPMTLDQFKDWMKSADLRQPAYEERLAAE